MKKKDNVSQLVVTVFINMRGMGVAFLNEVLESERCVHVDGSILSVARPLFFAVEMLDQFNKIVVNLLVVMTGVWFIWVYCQLLLLSVCSVGSIVLVGVVYPGFIVKYSCSVCSDIV